MADEGLTTAQESEHSFSRGKRFWNTYFAPGELFRDLAIKPDWLVPCIIVLVITLASTYVLWPRVIMPSQLEQIEQREGIPDEQREVMMSRVQSTAAGIFAVVTAGVVAMVSLLAVGGVVHLVGSFLLGGTGSYKAGLSIACYSSLVAIPGAIVKIPIMLYKNTLRVQTGLGLLCEEAAERSFGCSFLDKFDIFSIWQLVLIILGTAIVYKSTAKKTTFVLVPIWLVWSLLTAFLATRGLGQ